MQTKNVAFVGAICITIGWLLASIVSPPIARVQTLPQERTKPSDAATTTDETRFTEQLHLRLRQVPATPVGRRNPFVFATRERAVDDDAASGPAVAAPAEASPVVTVPRPAYVLSGIGIRGDIRTAVLSTGQDVRIVAVNDAIGGYTVVEITENSVTLANGDERHTLRFAQ